MSQEGNDSRAIADGRPGQGDMSQAPSTVGSADLDEMAEGNDSLAIADGRPGQGDRSQARSAVVGAHLVKKVKGGDFLAVANGEPDKDVTGTLGKDAEVEDAYFVANSKQAKNAKVTGGRFKGDFTANGSINCIANGSIDELLKAKAAIARYNTEQQNSSTKQSSDVCKYF